jgi:hypothetical protein
VSTAERAGDQTGGGLRSSEHRNFTTRDATTAESQQHDVTPARYRTHVVPFPIKPTKHELCCVFPISERHKKDDRPQQMTTHNWQAAALACSAHCHALYQHCFPLPRLPRSHYWLTFASRYPRLDTATIQRRRGLLCHKRCSSSNP